LTTKFLLCVQYLETHAIAMHRAMALSHLQVNSLSNLIHNGLSSCCHR